jgi:hypothetical protein
VIIPYLSPKNAEQSEANWRKLDTMLSTMLPFVVDATYAIRFTVNKDVSPVAMRLEAKAKNESEWRVMQSWPLGGFENVSADRTLTGSESVILVDTTDGNVAITLPLASDNEGNRFTVKKIVAANLVTIGRTGTDTIDGATSQVLTYIYTSLDLISDGSAWYII